MEPNKTKEELIAEWAIQANKKGLKNLESLYPPFREKIERILDRMRLKGQDAKVVFGLRSKKEQDDLYAQGRTKPGKVVTMCKYPDSYHCLSIAVDICHRKLGYNVPESFWKMFADLAVEEGLSAGFYWKKFMDRPHTEDRTVDTAKIKELLRQAK
jgi:peptidoglycan L-alanyl-D-glutamate endopeptidase CwlK